MPFPFGGGCQSFNLDEQARAVTHHGKPVGGADGGGLGNASFHPGAVTAGGRHPFHILQGDEASALLHRHTGGELDDVVDLSAGRCVPRRRLGSVFVDTQSCFRHGFVGDFLQLVCAQGAEKDFDAAGTDGLGNIPGLFGGGAYQTEVTGIPFLKYRDGGGWRCRPANVDALETPFCPPAP